jgi:hypothetical protein
VQATWRRRSRLSNWGTAWASVIDHHGLSNHHVISVYWHQSAA